MSRYPWNLVWALTIAACIAVGLLIRSHSASPAPTFESSGPTITQLEKLGTLITLKIHVADVLTGANGTYNGAWLIKGDAVIAVDLTKAKLVDKQSDKKIAIISLPPPRVIQARVDHSKTKTWSVQNATFLPGWMPWIGSKGDPDQLRDAAMAQGQKLVEYAANTEESLNQARTIAANMITDMYRLVDWHVDVMWQDAGTKHESSAVER